jgi:hypothetical protein
MDVHRYRRALATFLAVTALFAVLPAHAKYAFTTVDFPGVKYSEGGYTEMLGIDNHGVAVGFAQIDASSRAFSFRYDSKCHLFTRLPEYATGGTASFTIASGINDFGTIVGGETQNNEATEFAFVLKQDVFELLSRPGSKTFTQARAVNIQGHVSGYALNDSDGTYSGFIYDPLSDEWTDVLPSPATIAQGLNSHDELVGSVYENAGVVCAACQAGTNGFIRAPGGFVAIFSINGAETEARGITDAGMITGFVWVDDGQSSVGFVIPAPKREGFQTVSVSAKDFIRVPGATQTFPEGISNDGTLAGFWMDESGATHGFIAAVSQ